MIRFGTGLVGLIIIASATDTVSLAILIAAAVPCVALMLRALPDLAE